MKVEWSPRSLKEFAQLDSRVQKRVVASVERLASTGQGDVKRLVDVRLPEYRRRVGDVRVIFQAEMDTQTILIYKIGPVSPRPGKVTPG